MDTAGKITELRSAMARVGAPLAAPRAPMPIGWDAVDVLLGGGLASGRIAEVIGARSSGKTSLAIAAAARATTAGRLIAWIDAAHELYPPAAAALGVDLDRLLVVHPPPTAIAAARAAEIVARSAAFALVVIDLPRGARLPDQVAARLRAAAHDTGVGMLVLATSPAVPHPALRLDVIATRDRGHRRVDVTLARGGAAPEGTRATLYLGEPMPGSAFRAPTRTAALLAVAPMGPRMGIIR